jgi:hypothetical protein
MGNISSTVKGGAVGVAPAEKIFTTEDVEYAEEKTYMKKALHFCRALIGASAFLESAYFPA